MDYASRVKITVQVSVWLLVSLAGSLVVGCTNSTDYDGDALFAANCTGCHGAFGEGDGHVAALINIRPPNLRRIAERNNGVFPSDAVIKVIDGRDLRAEHDLPQMPIWGERFGRGADGQKIGKAEVKAKITAIADHLESIQR